MSLLWRHNEHDSVSNHQPPHCLLNRLFRHRSKKTSKLRVTGLCVGNSPGPVNSPHKWPVTRKMFPFDDVIMLASWHGHAFRITGLVEGESTGYRWFSPQRASDAGFDVVFDVSPINRLLSKQSNCRWFKTPQQLCNGMHTTCPWLMTMPRISSTPWLHWVCSKWKITARKWLIPTYILLYLRQN